MKKLLLLAVCLVAVVAARAQDEIVYNFYDSFEWCAVIDEEWGGNYDFIDKTGTTINQEGIMLCENDDDGWHAVADYLDQGISLTTGEMGARADLEASGDAFIAWGEAGPSRTTLMYGWDNREAALDAGAYGPETADDWVPSRNALNFLRNANSGSREDTYLQLPAVTGPHTLNVWVGSQGGSYAANLCLLATPVVDGVAGESFTLVDTENYTAKCFRKVSTSYDGEGSVAWRLGCNKMEVYLTYITIEAGPDTGIHDAVVAGGKDGDIYNLQGMKVGADYKGIVIKDGRKYVQY